MSKIRYSICSTGLTCVYIFNDQKQSKHPFGTFLFRKVNYCIAKEFIDFKVACYHAELAVLDGHLSN